MCRVTSGLSDESTTDAISCLSSGKDLVITKFANFTPQYIEVKVQAYNPSFSGPTPDWKIYTYQDTSMDTSK